MHETETIEMMRCNWWATRVFHQTSKREHALPSPPNSRLW